MNDGYHGFNFTEKTFLRSVDPKQPKNVKFSLDLIYDFSGAMQKFSGEVQNNLSGGAHLPSKSGHDPNHDPSICIEADNENTRDARSREGGNDPSFVCLLVLI
jgi:hypothetical protein